MKKAKNSLMIVLVMGLVTLFVSGCSDVKFQNAKMELINESPVFGNERNQQNEQIDSSDQETLKEGDSPSVVEEGPVGEETGRCLSREHCEDGADGSASHEADETVRVDVRRSCSNSKSEESGNVIEANLVSMKLLYKGREVVCESLLDFRSLFLNRDKFEIPVPCKIIKKGEYHFRFYDPEHSGKKELGEVKVKFEKGVWDNKVKNLDVVYGLNKRELASDDSALMDVLGENSCDSYNSPLVILLNRGSRLELSSPSNGVDFDIRGRRGGHTKSRISWPVDDNVAFLSLPNSNGLVQGIDELFGDNTFGPDGRFSAHGYEALGKYDDNRDRKIDRKDSVFQKLRLFVDSNRDGKSQDSELYTLTEKGITAIDLDFDSSYDEEDDFGNKILFKSIAETNNQMPFLIFDIWFRDMFPGGAR